MKKRVIIAITLVFSILMSSVCVSAGDICSHDNSFCAHSESESKIEIPEQKKICSADMSDEFLSDELIVVLNNVTSMKLKDYTKEDFSEVNCIEVQDLTSSYVSKIKDGNTSRSKTNLGINTSTFNRILKLKIDNSNKAKVLSAVKILEQREDILAAEPVYNDLELCLVPNDDLYLYLSSYFTWGYDKIQMSDAWNITTGSYDVYVGVIDSGIDNSYEDMASQIDLEKSRSFADATLAPNYCTNPHGSQVASIIGAKGGNNLASVGVCWDVTMLSLKVDNLEGKISVAAVVLAINYANQENIPILNMSLGIYENSAALYEAIQNYSGLVVCPAGNGIEVENERIGVNNDENIHYPSNYNLPNLIAVGASSQNDEILEWSNFGCQTVDIFAPGENINCLGDGDDPLTYYDVDGTSFACSFVTGVAALLLSEYPTLTASELKQTIIMNVDDADDGVTGFIGKCVSGGRLNAYKSLSNPHYHSLTYSNSTIYSHTEACSICSYQATVSHSFDGDYDVSEHRGICSGCNCIITGYHDYTYKPYDSNTHQIICKICGYVQKRKFHRWVLADDGERLICELCHLLDDITENEEED